MFATLKRLLIGNALKTEELDYERYNVFWGLPIMSSDAISSVAYASEEILWVLIPVIGVLSFKYLFYASFTIIALLFILIFSYRQTIDSYPNGGGSYVVASDNLGKIPGLVAGASLSVDYILTVAVSASAGTAAITSAVPSLLYHKVSITLLLILIMTIGNLRGLRESSRLFGIPPYIFIVSMFILVFYGLFKAYVLGYTPSPQAMQQIPQAAGDITMFLFIRAFASGCTALTGIEAVSNGIPNFKEPSQKNANRVLMLLGILILIIFGGMSILATKFYAVPNYNTTVISQITSQVFGKTFMFYDIQIMTAVILTMAANTAFTGLPTLLSLIARDGYAPRQFAKRGERLGYSNGILLLFIIASLLTIIFKGETHLLMPLYAVGVFISFTLSQVGMFKRWVRLKTPGWRHKAIINGTGAVVTFIVSIVIAATKFMSGAWIVLILIPLMVYAMYRTKGHYNKVAKQLSMTKDEVEKELQRVNVTENIIVLVDTLNRASFKAINYAKLMSGPGKNIVAFHVSISEELTEKLKTKWEECNIGIPLEVVPSPYRHIMDPLITFIEEKKKESDFQGMITVVMPQFILGKWWDNIFHNQTALFIKQRLLHDRHVAVITVPYTIE